MQTRFIPPKMFTETNPDKGTKTRPNHAPLLGGELFTETNPDKGTKTVPNLYSATIFFTGLQKLTPIRGRKLCQRGIRVFHPQPQFTETNPDKGTKTCINVLSYTYEESSLQKLTPIRGRKRFSLLEDEDDYFKKGLQKLTPIRGRKLIYHSSEQILVLPFTETNPDKGTKTITF